MIPLQFSSIPPSTNKAYATFNGRRVKSSLGKKYEYETVFEASRQICLHPALDREKGYNLVYTVSVSLEDMFTKGYPKKAQNKYVRWDVSNRCKLFEDSVVKACGIDDANFIRVCGFKKVGTPGTTAWIWSPEDEWVSIDKLLENTPPT